MHMKLRRDRRLSILIANEEWAMLQHLAANEGVNASTWVRGRNRDEHVALFGVPEPRAAKRKR